MPRKGMRSIAQDTRGATVVEYAIILPVLLLLIMGIVEYNTMMYASAVLDGALFAAARTGTTNYVNTGGTGVCPSPVVNNVVVPQNQAAYINCLIGVRSAGLLDPAKLQISYNDTGSSSFNASSDAPAFTANCTNDPTQANPPSTPLCAESTQQTGDIVIYTATYPWPIYTPLLRPFLGTAGVVNLTSSTVVKNEPYPTTTR